MTVGKCTNVSESHVRDCFASGVYNHCHYHKKIKNILLRTHHSSLPTVIQLLITAIATIIPTV
jgi:predicted RNase H-like nuclease (RuvC/YqgF family)